MATASTVTAASMASPASPKNPLKLPVPNSDFYQLIDVLTAEELAIVAERYSVLMEEQD